MTRRTRPVITAAIAIICTNAAAQQYAITDLGAINAGSQANKISDSSLAVGIATNLEQQFSAFTWDGSFVTHPPLAGDTQTEGIDAAGDLAVFASYSLGTLDARAVLLDSGVPFELDTFLPRGVNATGQVVGERDRAFASGMHTSQAVLWDKGVLTPLADLGAGVESSAADINDALWIVGKSFPAESPTPRAALWIDGAVSDLGTLGGSGAHATAISNTRYVVGMSRTAAGQPHAFRYLLSPAGAVVKRTDLGVLDLDWSDARDVNDAGDVVGTSASRAFLYTNNQMLDLNDHIPANSGWRLTTAAGINNQGQIVGWGEHGPLGLRAFLLTPAAGCSPADLAEPFGALDFSDVLAFLVAFGSMDPAADLAPPLGVFDFSDVIAFLTAFAAGCP
ncbi:MAG: GC-type dockerin domain-anchored protein [Phycisphaerales bacterium]